MIELKHSAPGSWIPLMEYAIKKGQSLSTVRRHIKAKKVPFKVEKGRYLLWDNSSQPLEPQSIPTPEGQNTVLEKVVQELQKAQEEIAELKTLIALYEEKIPQQRIDN